jgi:hypothetical protein
LENSPMTQSQVPSAWWRAVDSRSTIGGSRTGSRYRAPGRNATPVAVVA